MRSPESIGYCHFRADLSRRRSWPSICANGGISVRDCRGAGRNTTRIREVLNVRDGNRRLGLRRSSAIYDNYSKLKSPQLFSACTTLDYGAEEDLFTDTAIPPLSVGRILVSISALLQTVAR